MAALWILALGLAVAEAEFCPKPGEVKYVEPASEYLCTRTGDMRGVDLLSECIKSLEHIAEDKTPTPTVHSTGPEYCLPGRSVRMTKQIYTCHCTKTNEWDCIRGKTDDKKPVPLEAMGRSIDSVKQRQCDKDIIVPKMFTDYCDLYGQYITFDDCLIPRNQTARAHSLAEEQGPITCLPGSFAIYMRCLRCPCVNGVPQGCSETVDCPWVASQ